MKISVDQDGHMVAEELFVGLLLKTEEGNTVGVCMRDDTIELSVNPGGEYTENWWRVNMQKGTVEKM